MLIALILMYFTFGAVFAASCILIPAIMDDDTESIKAYCHQWQFWKDTVLTMVLWPVGIVALIRYITNN